MADSTPKSYHTDPTLYLYTSLTAGSSHIITATARLETILKANRIPFQALDVATDEKARMLWGRRAGKRKLPGLVRMGMVVGDLDEIEEWNEYGELKQNIGSDLSTATPTPSTTNTPSKAPPSVSQTPVTPSKPTNTSPSTPLTTAMRLAGLEAAAKAADAKSKPKISAASPSPLAKLDNAAPTGMPPPTGTTDAESAQAPVTGGAVVESRADEVPATRGGGGGEGKEKEKESAGDALGGGGDEEEGEGGRGDVVEKDGKERGMSGVEGEGEGEAGEKNSGVRTVDATAHTDEAQDLPGGRTQEQEAGEGGRGRVEESVAD